MKKPKKTATKKAKRADWQRVAAEAQRDHVILNDRYNILQNDYAKAVETRDAALRDVRAAEARSEALQNRIEQLRGEINTLRFELHTTSLDLARTEGHNEAMRHQIDQAAPKVMVRPPVFVSPLEASEGRVSGDRARVDFDTGRIMTDRKPHWTQR